MLTCALYCYEQIGPEEAESLTRSSTQTRLRVLAAPRIHYRMTDPKREHPTQGRRRRHESPPTALSAPLLPVPRLADHLDTDAGPSDEEGGKKRSDRSQSRLLPSRLPAHPQTSTMRLWESLKWIQREAERF